MGALMSSRLIAFASLSLASLAVAALAQPAAAEDGRSCGLPQYLQTYVEALPGRVIDLSGQSADTFLRVAEIEQQSFERLIVHLHPGAAEVLTVVSRGNLVCAKKISLPRDKAQWGINMAFGETI